MQLQLKQNQVEKRNENKWMTLNQNGTNFHRQNHFSWSVMTFPQDFLVSHLQIKTNIYFQSPTSFSLIKWLKSLMFTFSEVSLLQRLMIVIFFFVRVLSSIPIFLKARNSVIDVNYDLLHLFKWFWEIPFIFARDLFTKRF